MRNKIKYSDMPIRARVVKDFLPSPENLVLREKKKRVTLTLTQTSLDFFKVVGRKQGVPYQAMIRSLVDNYVAQQKGG